MLEHTPTVGSLTLGSPLGPSVTIEELNNFGIFALVRPDRPRPILPRFTNF